MENGNFPSYLNFSEKEFIRKIELLFKILKRCELCPRKCRVNRLKGEKGYCGAGRKLKISDYFPHFGEEDVLTGHSVNLEQRGAPFRGEPCLVSRGGSGAIFLSWCHLKCLYCQNYQISCQGKGREIEEEEFADIVLKLQNLGCHNINLVTPAHFTSQIIKGLQMAVKKGLRLPIVWNCGGYENVKILKLLNGVVDIYMPDFKYGDDESALKYSNAPDYFQTAKSAVKEMHSQVGDLKITEQGIAYQGLLVRHLVLPNNLAKSEKILEFIAKEISKNTYINIMAQYRPCYKAFDYPELSRPLVYGEYERVIRAAKKFGLSRGFGAN